MKEQPLVSVLMTAYNREKYIAEAIESVMVSTYQNWELIIVDDCSRDQTVQIAKSYEAKDKRIKVYINEVNLGDYPNRNKAASYANGKYIKYIDADDIIYSYGLEVMVKYMEKFPGAGFGLASKPSDDKPFPIFLNPKEIYLENFLGFSHFDRAPGSSIILLEAFNRVSGFSGKRMIGDYEFWFNISRYYPMVKFPFDLYWNRVHESQESKTDYARKNYPHLRKIILNEALTHIDCPLSQEEIKMIKKKIKNDQIKNFFLRYSSEIYKFIS